MLVSKQDRFKGEETSRGGACGLRVVTSMFVSCVYVYVHACMRVRVCMCVCVCCVVIHSGKREQGMTLSSSTINTQSGFTTKLLRGCVSRVLNLPACFAERGGFERCCAQNSSETMVFHACPSSKFFFFLSFFLFFFFFTFFAVTRLLYHFSLYHIFSHSLSLSLVFSYYSRMCDAS